MKRAERESNQPNDLRIPDFESLMSYRGQIVKYSRDEGESWRYVRIQRDAAPGYFLKPPEYDDPDRKEYAVGLPFYGQVDQYGTGSVGMLPEANFDNPKFIAMRASEAETEGMTFSPDALDFLDFDE